MSYHIAKLINFSMYFCGELKPISIEVQMYSDELDANGNVIPPNLLEDHIKKYYDRQNSDKIMESNRLFSLETFGKQLYEDFLGDISYIVAREKRPIYISEVCVMTEDYTASFQA